MAAPAPPWWKSEDCPRCRSFDTILEQAPVPVFVVDREGRFVFINDTCLQLIGSPAREQSMQYNAFTVPAMKAVGLDQMLRRALAGERVADEVEYVSMWGKPAPIRLSISPIRDEAGEVVGAAALVIPLAALRQAQGQIAALEEELHAARLEQREMDRLRNRFMAIVSHEFRTPLVPVMGYLQMLNEGRMGPLNPEQNKAVQVALRNTQRLLELVEKVLTMTTDGQPAPPESLTPVPVEPLLREAVESMEPLMSDRKLEVTVRCDPGTPPVLADQARLNRVLMSLLENAQKFSNYGGRVGVFARLADQGRVHVEVANIGRSIPPEDRLRVFDPFYQVEAPLTRTYGGMGLGLAIVRDSLQAMGGGVEVVDREGYDTVIRLSLLRADDTASWLRPGKSHEVPEAAAFHLLVLDHRGERREALLGWAEEQGYAGRAVDSPGAALHELSSRPVNALVLGLDDPSGEALALVRQIRAGEVARLVPIIALTRVSDPSHKRRALDEGTTAVLVEPLDYAWLAKLLGAVHDTIF